MGINSGERGRGGPFSLINAMGKLVYQGFIIDGFLLLKVNRTGIFQWEILSFSRRTVRALFGSCWFLKATVWELLLYIFRENIILKKI